MIVFYPVLVFVVPEPCWLLKVDPVFGNQSESLSQPGQLYSDLPNHAVNRRVNFEMSMLDDEIATEAAASAEMQTQPADLPTAVDSMEAETAKIVGHTVKNGCGDE